MRSTHHVASFQGSRAGGTDARSVSVENSGVVISVFVDASVYRWTVLNRGSEPIARLEWPQANCYNQSVPDGWKWSYSEGHFAAWADVPGSALQSGSTGNFSARVTSAGAVLGIRPVSVSFASGRREDVGGAWTPVAKSTTMVAEVAIGVVAIAGLHIWLGRRSARGSES